MTMTTLIFFLIIAVPVALAVWLWKAASDPLGEQRDNAAKEWDKRRAQLLDDEGERYSDKHRNVVAPDPVELHRARKLAEAPPAIPAKRGRKRKYTTN